ncbi:SH3 domain-containing protein 21 isoform X2 [Gopherus flavomarginatus]|uniref:SH3 domain-containing protein 21 isoform X2 n=1 Tax=Gopherus flavomarginatus TaxID=286002 RepID=UPI0021CC03A2|nr:SH3 domain-containing protein 21 isoform X2 [Gopherus flavomarginatus]
MGEVLVLVDFSGQRDDELPLKAGDIVQKVESCPEEGWLQGELAGKTGLFPRQFVQEIPASLMADGGRRCPRSTRIAKKPPVQGQRWCKVNFSYTPEKADELQLKAGELVQILQEIEDGWWLGRKNGQVGAFPSNFVQELDRLPPGLVAPEAVPKNGARKQRPKLTDETFIIKEAAKPEPPKKLEKPIPAAQSPPPSQPLQPSTAPPSGDRVGLSSDSLPSRPDCEAEYCKAMFDYEPELQDELQLKRGDVVLVLCKETEDEGWWEGECDGKRGLFPDNFVMLLQPLMPKIKAVVPVRSQESIFRPEKKVSSASKAELRPPHEPKEPKVQKKMDLPKMNLPASKKAAPAPPVPAKTKLASSLAGRPPCTPTNCAPASAEKSKPKDPDANGFDAVLISNAKLSHPTTTRPKMPGRKLPSQPPASSPHVQAPLVPAKSSIQARELQPPESLGDPPKAEEKLSLEELVAELRSLRILMDLMRVQHQKDMEELKMEMKEEQAKRMVLQVRATGDAALHGKFRGGGYPSLSLTGISQTQSLSSGCYPPRTPARMLLLQGVLCLSVKAPWPPPMGRGVGRTESWHLELDLEGLTAEPVDGG